MEADLAFGGRGGWAEEGLQFAPDDLQGCVVFEERMVDFGQALEDVGVGRYWLAHLDEGADDVQAHGDGARAVQDGGRHDGAVFGEGVGRVFAVPSASGV